MSPARIILGGPEENRLSLNRRLCSKCENVFIRPNKSWDDEMYTQICYTKRAVDDFGSSATSGCVVCTIFYKAVLHVIEVRPWLKDSGVSCMLHWNKATNRFEDIYISLAQVYIKLLTEEEIQFWVCGKRDDMLSTSLDSSWNLITRWLTDCTENHSKCNQLSQKESWLPTRLVDVGSHGSGRAPRLIITREEQLEVGRTAYIALSHRWGSGFVKKLTTENITQFQCGIPLDTLPATFRDAILVARRLGVRYLWIDSLCILQGSKFDWQQESATMGRVYERSYCNFAATAAAEGHKGLFIDRDPSLVSPFKIDIQWEGHHRSYYFLYSGFWHSGVTKAPLNRRGWVIQERLLSPRTLSFNNQLFWECLELKACEAFPQGLGEHEDFEPEDVDDDSELCSKSWRTDMIKANHKYAFWGKIVEQLTASGLTDDADKLIAISGIAKRMQSLLGDIYVAGLWECNLTFDLLWYVEKGRQANWDPSFRVDIYRAPSWSWASVEGRVHFSRGRLDLQWGPSLLEILAVEIESVTADGTGQVRSGHILVSGILKTMQGFCEIPEYSFDLMPGAGTACCVDDESDESLVEIYSLPVRRMKSVNGEELLCLLLTPASDCASAFRRVGLLALKRDELEGFQWADGELDGGIVGPDCTAQKIKIV